MAVLEQGESISMGRQYQILAQAGTPVTQTVDPVVRAAEPAAQAIDPTAQALDPAVQAADQAAQAGTDAAVSSVDPIAGLVQQGIEMMGVPFPVSSIYIGINALIMLALALLVVRTRVLTKTDLGDGGNPLMLRAIRAHANNVEYVPMALLLLAVAEMSYAPVWLLHVLGLALTGGRIAHAAGLYQTSGASAGRLAGTILTWLVLLVGGVTCLIYGPG